MNTFAGSVRIVITVSVILFCSSSSFGNSGSKKSDISSGADTGYAIIPGSGNLGGISNVAWQTHNQQMVNELLAGDTLTVTFNPNFYDEYESGYQQYGLDVRVRDQKDSIDITYPFGKTGTPMPVVFSEPLYPFDYYYQGDPSFAQYASTGEAGTDSTWIVPNPGTFTSNIAAFSPNQYIANAALYTMNYNFYSVISKTSFIDSIVRRSSLQIDTVWYPPKWIQERYHLDTANVSAADSFRGVVDMSRAFDIMQGTADVPIYYDNTGEFPLDSGANMGQYDYLIQFTGSGVERDTFVWRPATPRESLICDVPYLTIKVTGKQIYHVRSSRGSDSVVNISYDLTTPDSYPNFGPVIQAGQWAAMPILWEVSPSFNGNTLKDRYSQYMGSILGYKNRYYLTAHPIDKSLDTNSFMFVNGFHIGGYTIYLDSCDKGPYRIFDNYANNNVYLGINNGSPATRDFKVGDVVRISYRGGIMGLPTPGASFKTVYEKVAAVRETPNAPEQLYLEQNYPNPFNITSDITFSVSDPALYGKAISVSLYNTEGKTLETLYRGTADANEHTLHVDGAALPAGNYFYTVECNGRTLQKEMTVIR